MVHSAAESASLSQLWAGGGCWVVLQYWAGLEAGWQPKKVGETVFWSRNKHEAVLTRKEGRREVKRNVFLHLAVAHLVISVQSAF